MITAPQTRGEGGHFIHGRSRTKNDRRGMALATL